MNQCWATGPAYPSGPQGVGESVKGGREERMSGLVRRRALGRERLHTAPQRQPDLRVVGWPASECPSKSSPTPGSLSWQGPSPGPLLCLCPAGSRFSSHFALQCRGREAGASSTYWAGYGSLHLPAQSQPDLPLCQGSAAPLSAPFSMILQGSSTRQSPSLSRRAHVVP